MDLTIAYSGSINFALALAGADLAAGDGLRTAVLVSLFTDRRANDDDVIPDGTDNRRGSWADAWPDDDRDLIGSRLWLLSRDKQLPAVLDRAKKYSEEALAWMIDDWVARAVTVDAEWTARGVLGLHTAIRLADGSLFTDVFNYTLEG